MSRVRSVLAWFVFIAGAFALPATTAGVHEDRVFRCQHSCVTPALSKWPTRHIKKDSLTPWSAVAQRASDRAHVLSGMADTVSGDSTKCQSSGAALGSQAYKQCRALLEDKMSIEKDVPPDRGYPREN
jgi:hypothetical protein